MAPSCSRSYFKRESSPNRARPDRCVENGPTAVRGCAVLEEILSSLVFGPFPMTAERSNRIAQAL